MENGKKDQQIFRTIGIWLWSEMEMKINGRWVFRAGAAGFTATPKSKIE
jgi:hypothetical protein